MGCRFLLTVLAVFALVGHVTSAPQPFEQYDLNEGFQCSTSDNESETCGKVSTDSFCYSLFMPDNVTNSYTRHMGGCWIGSSPPCLPHAQKSPQKAACIRALFNGAQNLFCCCVGSMCNMNAETLPPVDEQTPLQTVSKKRSKLPPEIQYLEMSHTLVVIMGFPGLMLLAIAGLVYTQRKFRKNPLFQSLDEETHGAVAGDNPTTLASLENLTLVEKIIEGRFGTVWLGSHHNRPVAVKIFEQTMRQSWLNEVDAYSLPQMEHPNILKFIGIKDSVNEPITQFWLVTSWHEAGSLYDYLRVNTVTYDQLLRLADSIVKGVMHLHAEVPATKYEMCKPAMAHRDIKSKNIIIKDPTTACIADLGFAIKFDPGQRVGSAHCQVGTYRYMSPEVLEGAISFDQEAFQRIDIYAVALVLWELLSRTKDCDPFPEYKLPFEDQVGLHPTMLVMQDVVVSRKQRPPIKNAWRNNQSLTTFVTTLEDCWDTDSDARLSASTMHERLQLLMLSNSRAAPPEVSRQIMSLEIPWASI